MKFLETMDELEAVYHSKPSLASTAKEISKLTPHYRQLIAASPFMLLATSGSEGLDCSPRGDGKGFVRVINDTTLAIPDRRGNNRIDSLRNIIRDPRVALLFLIPGSGTTFRVNGTARITTDAKLLKSFAVEDKEPRSVVIVSVESCYVQCARAIIRSDLWNPKQHVAEDSMPTFGQMLEAIKPDFNGRDYDAEWPTRAKASMW